MDLDEDLLDDDGMDDMFNADLGERDFPLLDPMVNICVLCLFRFVFHPLNPHDAPKHNFASLKIDLIF